MNYIEYLENAKKIELSKNFTLYDICHSDTAIKNKINNIPSPQIIANAGLVIKNILEPLVAKYKRVPSISSMFRSEQLNKEINKSIGGATKSQHLFGQAVDFTITKYDLKDVVEYIRHNLEFDQLILEPSWIHASFNKVRNRKQVLKYDGTNYINY